jgi:hypothetical protein
MSQPEHHIASHTTGPESAPQEAARLGPHERLIGVLISPTETFQDINRKPTWLAPLVISIVVASASLFFVNWRINPDWNRLTRQMMKEQMSALGGQTPSEDVIQQQVRVNEIIGRFLPAFPVVGTPFFYLVLAGIFTLGLLVMQAQTTFKKILSVVSWTFCGITLVAGLVNSASLMVRDEQSLASMNPFDPGDHQRNQLVGAAFGGRVSASKGLSRRS